MHAGEDAGVVRYRLGQDVIGQSRYYTEEEALAWEIRHTACGLS